MTEDEASDYALWVKLANDPSQTEESRQRYRAQMEAHVHRKLRQAFQFALHSTAPAPKKP
jgi:flagellar biosynthesis protein FliP